MTTMEKLGLAIGILIALLRLPAIFWPAAYVRAVRSMILERPLVVRALGALLLLFAGTIVILVAQTLTLFQAVMLVVAVLFVAGGTVMLAFTDGYRALTERIVAALPDVAVRIGGVVGVALGLWIVALSFSLR
jgi:hypothetical protein